MILIYIPCANKEEAEKIGRVAVERHLAACANSFPITSCYGWKNSIKNEKEVVVLLKTSESKADELEQEIKKLHSYDIPCILRIKADVNEEYKEWMDEQMKKIQEKKIKRKEQ